MNNKVSKMQFQWLWMAEYQQVGAGYHLRYPSQSSRVTRQKGCSLDSWLGSAEVTTRLAMQPSIVSLLALSSEVLAKRVEAPEKRHDGNKHRVHSKSLAKM